MNSAAFIKHLHKLIDEGKVSEKLINTAFARIIKLKLILGLFNDPYRYMNDKHEKETIEKLVLVKKAFVQTENFIFLLKNNGARPLSLKFRMCFALVEPMIKNTESLNGRWAIHRDHSKRVSRYSGITFYTKEVMSSSHM